MRPTRGILSLVLVFVLIGAIGFILRSRLARRANERQASLEQPIAAPATVSSEHIIPGRQIGPIALGMTQDEVKTALGEPDSKLNKMWSWKDPQMSVGFGPDSTVRVILAGGVGVTPRRVPFRSTDGIAIGATPEQVITAWGQPDSDRTDKAPLGVPRQMNYAGRGIQLLFYDGKLTWLSVRPPTAASTRAGS
jgi:hypothetical protein